MPLPLSLLLPSITIIHYNFFHIIDDVLSGIRTHDLPISRPSLWPLHHRGADGKQGRIVGDESNLVIIQIVSTEFHIPAGSMFVVLKTTQKFQSFRKSESWILLWSLLSYKVWDSWNFTYYYSNCLNGFLYSSWLNVCSSQNYSKFSEL